MPKKQVTLRFRKFSRREKTSIRQDVKRFEKIGRDHGCCTLDDYVEFVALRTRRDDDGFLTQKSFELFRGLGSYFGDQLLHNTTMIRVGCDIQPDDPEDYLTPLMAKAHPGWLLSDLLMDQQVIVPYLMAEHVFPTTPWSASLDDVFDQLIDWNQGYLSIEEVETSSLWGDDIDPLDSYAA